MGAELLESLVAPTPRESRRACVLMGMRQVGKTTLLLQLVERLLEQGVESERVLYFDFSDSRIAGPPPQPDEVLALARGSAAQGPLFVFFDEITKAYGKEQDQLGPWIKSTVDRVRQGRGRDLCMVLTDSSASLLSRHSTKESAFGRTREFTMLGFSLREFASVRAPEKLADQVVFANPDLLNDYLALGGLPSAVYAPRAADAQPYRTHLRDAIISRVAHVDLAALGQDSVQLARLLAYLMAHSGELFERQNLHSLFEADKRSLERWRTTLLNTGLFVSVPKDGSHRLKPKARARAAPKIHASEHGLVQAFALQHEERERSMGQVYEAVVLRHLRELQIPDFFYARDETGAEVDFVFEQGERRIGVEVTSSDSLKGKWGKGPALRRTFHLDRLVFVHGGADQREEEGLWSMPLPRFLLEPECILR